MCKDGYCVGKCSECHCHEEDKKEICPHCKAEVESNICDNCGRHIDE